jgi:hypothetical protein
MRRSLILIAIGIIVVAGGIYFIARDGDHDPTFDPAGSGLARRTASMGGSGVTIEPRRLNGPPPAFAISLAGTEPAGHVEVGDGSWKVDR